MSGPEADADPAAGLAAVHETRRRLADQYARGPRALVLQAIFAVLVSGFVAANAAPAPWNLTLDLGLVLGVVLLVWSLRTRYGVYLNGLRRGGWPALVTLALVAGYLAAFYGSLWLKQARGIEWAPVAGAALLFPFTLAGYMLWTRAYRLQIERGP